MIRRQKMSIDFNLSLVDYLTSRRADDSFLILKHQFMKSTILTLSALFIFLLFAFMVPTKKDITGHWVIYYGQGEKITLNFKTDGTFLGEIPAEHFVVAGEYKFQNDILSMSDTSCNKNYWGKYKETFFTNDSVFSTVIEDSCQPRRSAADKATMIRVKM